MFKIGDKVHCIDTDGCHISKDKVYEVLDYRVKYSEPEVCLNLSGYEKFFWFAKRFQVIPEPFKVGDKVTYSGAGRVETVTETRITYAWRFYQQIKTDMSGYENWWDHANFIPVEKNTMTDQEAIDHLRAKGFEIIPPTFRVGDFKVKPMDNGALRLWQYNNLVATYSVKEATDLVAVLVKAGVK